MASLRTLRARSGGRNPAWLMLALATVALPLQAADPTQFGLQKIGEGRMKFFGISLYKASLWSADAIGQPDPTREPVLLRINYERDISRDRIMSITREEWRRLEVAEPGQQAIWLNQLEALLPNVRTGDQLASLTVPSEATRFYLGDKEIGTIDDPDFGEAFLAIWLDPRARAGKLRAALLAESSLAD
jgi:hypothetical protein